MSFQRPQTPDAAEAPPAKPQDQARAHLHRILSRHLEAIDVDQLPRPMPPTVREAIEWWLNDIMEPQKRWERPLHYVVRVGNCMWKFLSLTVSDRETIVAGHADGARWRGESVAEFVRIADETAKMAVVGVQQYAKTPGAFLAQKRRAVHNRQHNYDRYQDEP